MKRILVIALAVAMVALSASAGAQSRLQRGLGGAGEALQDTGRMMMESALQEERERRLMELRYQHERQLMELQIERERALMQQQRAEGQHCVSETAKIGDKLKHPDGRVGTVQKLSGFSGRCQNTAMPILAVITFEQQRARDTEGWDCVGANAKVGDVLVRRSDGRRATVKVLSGTSDGCTNPTHPISALLVFE